MNAKRSWITWLSINAFARWSPNPKGFFVSLDQGWHGAVDIWMSI